MSPATRAAVPRPRPKAHDQRHPGVYIVKVKARDGGKPWLHLKWRSPDDKSERKESLGTRDPALAKRAALLKSAWLRAQRDASLLRLAAGLGDARRYLISDEIAMYFGELERAPNRSPYTLKEYGRALNPFMEWCATVAPGAPLRYLDQLTAVTLNDWYIHVRSRRKEDGSPYKVSTVNQELKPVRTMLRRACGTRAPHLNSDILRRALPHTPTAKRKDKHLYGLETARALSVAELRALLTAALAYDAREARSERSAAPCAPDIALLLLTGLRRGELAQVRCRMVLFDEREHATLDLPAAICKGYSERKVHARGFSALVVELLRVLVAGRGGDEWLSSRDYNGLGIALVALPEWGAPQDVTPHDLRATCDTYQLALGRIDPKRTTARMGHSLAVAEESYLQPPPGMRQGAATLEQAMGCEDLLYAVIDAVRERKQSPRTERRSHKRVPVGLRVPDALKR